MLGYEACCLFIAYSIVIDSKTIYAKWSYIVNDSKKLIKIGKTIYK